MHISDSRKPVMAVSTTKMKSASISATDRMSERVVDALAAATDTDPLGLEPPLYRSIDLDALDRIFARGSTGRVQFDYDSHEVVVSADGTVAVDGNVYQRGP